MNKHYAIASSRRYSQFHMGIQFMTNGAQHAIDARSRQMMKNNNHAQHTHYARQIVLMIIIIIIMLAPILVFSASLLLLVPNFPISQDQSVNAWKIPIRSFSSPSTSHKMQPKNNNHKYTKTELYSTFSAFSCERGFFFRHRFCEFDIIWTPGLAKCRTYLLNSKNEIFPKKKKLILIANVGRIAPAKINNNNNEKKMCDT